MEQSRSAILKTLLYSDIFQYPLTEQEIWKFLIDKNIPHADIAHVLKKGYPLIIRKENFYFIQQKENLVVLRKKRMAWSDEKIKLAKKISRKLSVIPTISLLAISGSVAMQNAGEYDDIDLFVIVKPHTVWISRLLLLFFLELLGKRRKKGNKKVANKFCVNMLVDESSLAFNKKFHDLYSAHEITQIMPLSNKNKTYERFLSVNTWILEYLPNVFKPILFDEEKESRQANIILCMLEYIAKKSQYFYMKKKITREYISDTILAFHPIDYRGYVLGEYEKRIKKYEI